MIRRVLVWSPALLLITSAQARERTPLEQARRIARGSRVQVELKTRRIVWGRLRQMTDTSFTLDPVKVGGGLGIEMLFQDVSQIRSDEPTIKDVLLRPLQVLPLIPIALGCWLGAIFHYPCSDL
jgi:hypothetical protein